MTDVTHVLFSSKNKNGSTKYLNNLRKSEKAITYIKKKLQFSMH